MGNLLEFNKSKYSWDENGNQMNKPEITGLQYNITFVEKMKFKRATNKFECMGCGKECVKGTRYIGDAYEKICYRCAPEWVKKTKIMLTEINETCDEVKKEVKKCKNKWDKEVLVNSLE